MEDSKVKVAWVSRHPPLLSQLIRLSELLGEEVEIIPIDKTFRNVREVYEDVKRTGAKYAVLVLPLSMIATLVNKYKDVTWLWAEMEALHEDKNINCPEYNERTDVMLPARTDNGMVYRHMRFKDFYVIKQVKLVLEPLNRKK